jgi:hypothetical protein
MYSSDIDKRKDRLSKLEDLREIDAVLLFDEFSTVIYEHSKNYLRDINLQNFMEHQDGFKVSLNEQDSIVRHVLLVEKGIVFFYQFNSLSLLILAGYRESADIFDLQIKLDSIVNDLKI